MNNDYAQKAINTALKGEWAKAAKVNQKILKSEPDNIDALNRLSRAFAETGNLKRAKAAAKKVIKIDPYNNIALRSLKKWSGLKPSRKASPTSSKTGSFLEEPGKTKFVQLLHVGPQNSLSELDSGDEVTLSTSSHRVSIVTKKGKYIGRLPDDLAAKIKKLTSAGNEYELFIKSVKDSRVIIFIREIKRVKRLASIPSFSTEKIDYISFTPPELVHKKGDRPDTQTAEEEEVKTS